MKKRIFKLKAISVLIVLILLSNVSAQEASPEDEVKQLMAQIESSLKARNHDDVIDKSTKLLAIKPKFGDIYAIRGTAYMMKGDKEKALADFSQGIKLGVNPKMAVAAHKMRAILLYQAKRYDEAIQDFSFLIEKEPSEFRAYVQRGWSFFYKGNHQAALADFDAALKLNPQETGIRRFRAQSHYQLGNYEKAVEDISE